MRNFGFFLAGVGLVWAIYAFNMKTTVSAGGFYAGGISIPSQEVHNLGLLEDRRNHLLGAGFTALIGVLLIGFGSMTQNREGKNAPLRSQEKQMADLGITFEDGLYLVGEYEYPSLSQAVIHAKATKAQATKSVV